MLDLTATYSLLALMPSNSPGGQPPPAWTTFVPLGIAVVIFYFMLIRPQQQRQKNLDQMMKALKRGDKVLTTSGIIASVVSVGDKTLTIRSAESKLEIQRSAVAEILERAANGDSPAS